MAVARKTAKAARKAAAGKAALVPRKAAVAAPAPAPPQAVAAPAPAPAAAKPPKIQQNGVTRPAAGTKTARVWDIADAISAREQRPAKRAEVKAQFVDAEGGNNSTATTQYGRWRKFHGLTGRDTTTSSDDTGEEAEEVEEEIEEEEIEEEEEEE